MSAGDDGWLSWAGRVAYGAADTVWNGTAETSIAPRKFAPMPEPIPRIQPERFLTASFTNLSPDLLRQAKLLADWVLKDLISNMKMPIHERVFKHVIRDKCFNRWADFLFAPHIMAEDSNVMALSGPSLGWHLLWTFRTHSWRNLQHFANYHRQVLEEPKLGMPVPVAMLKRMVPISDIAKGEEETSKLTVVIEWKGVWRFAKIVGHPRIMTHGSTTTLGYECRVDDEDEPQLRYTGEIGVLGQPFLLPLPQSSHGADTWGYMSSRDDATFKSVRYGDPDRRQAMCLREYQASILRVWASDQEMDCKESDVKLRKEMLPFFYSDMEITQGHEVPWGAVWNGFFAQYGLEIARENKIYGLAMWRAYFASGQNYAHSEGFQHFVDYHKGKLRPISWIPNLLAPLWVLKRTSFSEKELPSEKELVVVGHPQGGTLRLGRAWKNEGSTCYVNVVDDRLSDALGSGVVGPLFRRQAPGALGVIAASYSVKPAQFDH